MDADSTCYKIESYPNVLIDKGLWRRLRSKYNLLQVIQANGERGLMSVELANALVEIALRRGL